MSVTIPCYNVATYLPEMMRSLEEQLCDPSNFEVVFVVDGSPDRSEQIIAQWMQAVSFSVVLAVQENQGVAGARNTGVSLASAELIVFVDPDDRLSPNYLEEFLDASIQFTDVDLFVSRMIRVDASGRQKTHPLDFKFAGSENARVVDLFEQPHMIHLAGGTIMVRAQRLRESDLEHDLTLRHGFEDAKLITQLLLRSARPKYVIVPRAQYFYQLRSDSIVATSSISYVPKLRLVETTYDELLNEAGVDCPPWLANVLLYDLYWVFKQFLNMHSAIFALDDTQRKRFSEASRAVLIRIGIENIRAFNIVNIPLDIRAGWEAAASPGGETHIAVARASDQTRGLQKIVFHSSDSQARSQVRRGTLLLEVPFLKAREVLFFDEPWVYEHIYWVATGPGNTDPANLRFLGQTHNLDFVAGGKVFTPREAGRFLKKVPPATRKSATKLNGRGFKSSKLGQLCAKFSPIYARLMYSGAYRAGGILGWRKNFRDAWVLIDRNIQANDNAEALYRYLRAERPEINAWFVIDKSSQDYKRLKRDGFKLVDHQSKKHFVLMKEAKVLASSMIDQYIVKPFPFKYLPQTWMYSFLQHGVTKERLHRWWNVKNIDHLVTSTTDEHNSLVSDPGPYKLSQREVTLTGMPRHDRLFQLTEKARANPSSITRIVLMPTWRNYLMGASSGAEREHLDGFYQSQFVLEWSAFLNSEYLTDLAKSSSYDVVLLPHPGIDAHWADLKLPIGVRRLSYVGDDVQELLAGASLVITDYSSQAFEGAFCGAPTVYFQFDREEFFSAGHIGSPGYFDYFNDGFGPVCEDQESLQRNVEMMLSNEHPELPTYVKRIQALYPLRDGGACERVVLEIESRLQPYHAGR